MCPRDFVCRERDEFTENVTIKEIITMIMMYDRFMIGNKIETIVRSVFDNYAIIKQRHCSCFCLSGSTWVNEISVTTWEWPTSHGRYQRFRCKYYYVQFGPSPNETKCSRMDQVKFMKAVCLPQILLGPFMNTLSPNDEFLLYTVANYSQLGNRKNSFHLSLIIGSSKHGSSPSFGINCAVGTQDFPKS